MAEKTISQNKRKVLNIGMHDALIDGNVVHDIPTRLVFVSDENELDALTIWNARDNVAEIARVCILPAWQGNGLAGLLLKRAEAWLAAKGFKTVHLLVERRHLPAIKTYLNAGYEIMGRCSMYGHEYYACEKNTACQY